MDCFEIAERLNKPETMLAMYWLLHDQGMEVDIERLGEPEEFFRLPVLGNDDTKFKSK